jgi:hypothetical protein
VSNNELQSDASPPSDQKRAASGGKKVRLDLLQIEKHVVDRVEAILRPIGEAGRQNPFHAFALVAAASLVACPLLFLIFWLALDLSWWTAILWAVLVLVGVWGTMAVLSCIRDPSRAAEAAARAFADAFPPDAPARPMAVNVVSAKMQIMVEDAYDAIRRDVDPATVRAPMPEYTSSEYLLWRALLANGVIDAETAASPTAVFEEGCRRWGEFRHKKYKRLGVVRDPSAPAGAGPGGVAALYTCRGCGADASQFASTQEVSLDQGEAPFGRCQKCKALWCGKCARQGFELTCPECGGKLTTKL